MDNFNLKPTGKSPDIKLNAETGICEISGESFMENGIEFYDAIYDWFNEYAEQVKGNINLILKLEYMNSSSLQHIYNLIVLLKKIKEGGLNVKVEWHYDDEEIDLEEDIEDIALESGMEIGLIPI